jgi:hypothetical protein
MLLDDAFRAKLVALPAVAGDSSLFCGYCRCSYRRYTYLSSRGVLFLFLETMAADEVQQRKSRQKRTDFCTVKVSLKLETHVVLSF